MRPLDGIVPESYLIAAAPPTESWCILIDACGRTAGTLTHDGNGIVQFAPIIRNQRAVTSSPRVQKDHPRAATEEHSTAERGGRAGVEIGFQQLRPSVVPLHPVPLHIASRGPRNAIPSENGAGTMIAVDHVGIAGWLEMITFDNHDVVAAVAQRRHLRPDLILTRPTIFIPLSELPIVGEREIHDHVMVEYPVHMLAGVVAVAGHVDAGPSPARGHPVVMEAEMLPRRVIPRPLNPGLIRHAIHGEAGDTMRCLQIDDPTRPAINGRVVRLGASQGIVDPRPTSTVDSCGPVDG